MNALEVIVGQHTASLLCRLIVPRITPLLVRHSGMCYIVLEFHPTKLAAANKALDSLGLDTGQDCPRVADLGGE